MARVLNAFVTAAVLLIFSGLPANASPEVRKAANLMTMSEAVLATITLVSQRFDVKIEKLSWSANFSERQWMARLNGNINQKDSQMTITGYGWGGDEETLFVNYSGTGTVGGESLLIHGTAKWIYDKEASDYQRMDFQQVTKIGQNSFWGWVLGAEIIVGGAGGAFVAVAGSTAATGGLALGAAPWIAAGGAAGGVATLITISVGAQSLLETDMPPPAPPKPKRPTPPKKGDTISPKEGNIIIAISTKNTISGSAVDGVHFLSGMYLFEEGVAQGTISVVGQ